MDTINKTSGINVAMNANYKLETRNKHKGPRGKEGIVLGLSVSDREPDIQGDQREETQAKSRCWKN